MFVKIVNFSGVHLALINVIHAQWLPMYRKNNIDHRQQLFNIFFVRIIKRTKIHRKIELCYANDKDDCRQKKGYQDIDVYYR